MPKAIRVELIEEADGNGQGHGLFNIILQHEGLVADKLARDEALGVLAQLLFGNAQRVPSYAASYGDVMARLKRWSKEDDEPDPKPAGLLTHNSSPRVHPAIVPPRPKITCIGDIVPPGCTIGLHYSRDVRPGDPQDRHECQGYWYERRKVPNTAAWLRWRLPDNLMGVRLPVLWSVADADGRIHMIADEGLHFIPPNVEMSTAMTVDPI